MKGGFISVAAEAASTLGSALADIMGSRVARLLDTGGQIPPVIIRTPTGGAPARRGHGSTVWVYGPALGPDGKQRRHGRGALVWRGTSRSIARAMQRGYPKPAEHDARHKAEALKRHGAPA